MREKVLDLFEMTTGGRCIFSVNKIKEGNYYEKEEKVVIENKIDKEVEINIPQINADDIENQIKKWEEDFNKWYEVEGKQYEEQLKNELSSFYQELINQAKPNN